MTKFDALIANLENAVNDDRFTIQEHGLAFNIAEPLLVEALDVRNDLRKNGALPVINQDHAALAEELDALSCNAVFSDAMKLVFSQAAKALRT